MPETKAIATGVESGVALESVSFFASILVPLDLPPYAFRAYEIKHSAEIRSRSSASNPASSGTSAGLLSRIKALFVTEAPAPSTTDIEAASRKSESPDAAAPDMEGVVMLKGVRRQNTLREKVENTLISGGRNKRPAIPAKLTSPLHMLTLFSFFISLAILACAVYWHDGTAILSIALISFASSIVSYATWWEPRLMSVEGTENRKLPDGDIMIRTREGAFIYVKCKEDVARELFSGTEECKYRVNGGGHNLLMASGTVILMLAIVLLGNCKWNSQIFIGGAYITLNGLYWGLGMLPKKYFWDLSRYTIRDFTPADAQNAHKRTKPRDTHQREQSLSSRLNTKLSRMGTTIAHPRHPPPEESEPLAPVDPDSRACFTRTLWYAIREARSEEWVIKNKAAPNTPVWNKWLEEAGRAARRDERGWKAVLRKDELIEEAQREKEAQRERERQEDRGRARAATIPEE